MTATSVHHCHALFCNNPCPPRWLMCRDHWSAVPIDLQREVYCTVATRGRSCDATWAPWWRASHRAIAHVARQERAPIDVAKWLAKNEAFADKLEGKETT